MATLKGAGAIFGVGTTATVGVVLGTNSRTSSDFSYEGTIVDLPDSDGDTVGCAVHDKKKTLSISVILADTTTPAIADVGTDLNTNLLVAPGTAVTITSAAGATSISAVAGAYMLTGSRFRESNTGYAIYECDLVRYDGITSYADIS